MPNTKRLNAISKKTVRDIYREDGIYRGRDVKIILCNDCSRFSK